MPRTLRVWDPFVRVFHWSLVAGFTANAFFTAPGKSLHRWTGYAVIALIVLRIVWGLIGPRHARFRSFPPDARAALAQMTDIATGRRHRHEGHSPLGALMVYNLLVTFLAIGLTGWMLTTLSFFGVAWVEDLHVGFVTWAEICVVLHVAAVLYESRRLGINLPKSMITGYKTFR